MKKVSAKDVIEHAIRTYNNHASQTPEMLQQTVGGLNGMNMEVYNKGYTDALAQLINFFDSVAAGSNK